ncbi:MAG TPA: auxin-binding protein, partial [Thermoanaerobaculia bacterium]|nr:auxin-binding protein [Thermoanaerobaculia bacterium]
MTSTYRSINRHLRATARMAVLASIAFVAGCTASAQAPKNLDYSRTRTSDQGVYRGTIRPAGDSIPQGKLQSWMLHLETATGASVDSVTVFVDGGMPQH